MDTKQVKVEARDGSKEVTDALLVICPQCSGDSFKIFVVHGHNHLQCATCNETFCQGGGAHGDIFCGK